MRWEKLSEDGELYIKAPMFKTMMEITETKISDIEEHPDPDIFFDLFDEGRVLSTEKFTILTTLTHLYFIKDLYGQGHRKKVVFRAKHGE